MTIKMIVATGSNFEIGINNKLLWHLPEDMRYFKEQTKECVVIMGRNTFDSLNLPKGLSERKNVVITKNPDNSKHHPNLCSKEGSLIFTDINQLVLEFKNDNFKNVWVIGGSQIYEEFIDYVDEIHWTSIEKSYPEANKFLSNKVIDVMIKEFDNGVRVKNCYDEKSDTHFSINVLKRIK